MKRCCWDINKRGAVGETPLHLCLLDGSTLHKDLAKRLVRLFPELVNDIYLMDEYYGENALHMAIVNEDPNMVKYLLQFNVDMYQRCCGNFFLPEDQKSGRQESLIKEYPVLPLKTNYVGRFYFGEYPLSFAATLDQFDCVRLLLTKGVDPNKQDSNGNTVLHMLVIHNKLVRKLLFSHTIIHIFILYHRKCLNFYY
jgi:transient receptor potential cation channel subfamily V protein 5